jgi:general stress protein 26
MVGFGTFKKYFEPKNNKTGYLATIVGRGRPTLRPVSIFLVGRKICFCTGTDNAKVKQLEKNAHVEVCIPVNRGRWRGYYRIAGEAELIPDRALKGRIFKKLPFRAEEFWKGADDPNFTAVVIKPQKSRYLAPGRFQEADVKL